VTNAGASAVEEPTPEGSRGEPFDLPGGPDAVLLLHGLTGSPFEVRLVADRLHAAGYRCRAPLLAGHGGDPRALAGVGWARWVEGARRELAALEGARRTFVVGCSMGALVACALAHEAPERVDGLALLAPALRLAGTARLAALLARHTPLRRALVPKLGGSDVRDRTMRRANPTMRAVPLSAVGELDLFARHVDGLLPAVAAPALVVAGARDHTVTLAGARRTARRLGASGGRLVVLPRSFHLVGIDVERERCAGEVLAFFDGLPVPASTSDASDHEGGVWRRRT
jgi:carboxylesterase